MSSDAITRTYNRAIPAGSPWHLQPRIFDSDDHPVRLDSLALLNQGIRNADLAAQPAVLPDFYHKKLMEMPSSIAVATRETIEPTFTSAALNCGMALVGLDIDKPHETAIRRFYDDVRTTYPYPPKYRAVLTADEVVRCAVEGAAFAVDRYG
ncbi:MAG TPA: hypothetical protein VLR46_13450, partial [Candidatus Dormibacteraeota bacterium]|nr:hypothetical protein [Candidatus Dormibacteraeota bacterium]